MYVLGINSVYHESSACLLRDGAIVAAAEEERFNRVKHGKQARADNPDELPVHAIEFCLRQAGIRSEDVAHVACGGDPSEMMAVWQEGRPSAWSRKDHQELFLASLPNVEKRARELGFTAPFHWVAHHTAHAASAYYAATFPEAAVLVVDALGDDAFSSRSYHGRGNRLTLLDSVPFPASLGYLWELVSVFLGFGVYDAAKVMGLAAYGSPARYADVFDRIVWLTPDGRFDMAHDELQFSNICYYPPSAYCDGLQRMLGIPPRRPDEPLLDVHHDLAAALQQKTDDVVSHLALRLHRMTGSKNLCMAGGVALNCVTNERLFAEGPYENLYIQPAAHDAGLAIGAALHVWNEVLGGARAGAMCHAYWGPSFTDDAIEAELQRHELRYERAADLERQVARLLADEAVIGFFQGAMELGPRALGNRSILADPRRRAMRDILNRKVKHREYFRPLAPSVLHEEAHAWFDIPRETLASDFMLMAYKAKPDKRACIEAVVHEDGTCRIQTVRRDVNPRFHGVISAFHELTGVPMVLNTSFNDQEPIICTPADAIDTFLRCEIDYLVIGGFLVRNQHGRRA